MDNSKAELGPEVWRRVFSSPLFKRTMDLLVDIFGRTFGFADIRGITKEEFLCLSMPRPPLIPFPFCELIWETQEGRKRCNDEVRRTIQRLCATKNTDISTCFAGLTEIAIPIILHGKYCGFIGVTGGLYLDQPSEEKFNKIKVNLKNLGVDLERLEKAYFQIKPVSKEMLDVMIRLINIVIEEVVKAAIESEKQQKRVKQLEESLSQRYGFDMIIGKSHAMQNIFKLLDKIIDSESPVLIEGETGTGKELIANIIHYNSYRNKSPFTAINCAAFSEQLLESELFGHVKGAFTGAIRDKKGYSRSQIMAPFSLMRSLRCHLDFRRNCSESFRKVHSCQLVQPSHTRLT